MKKIVITGSGIKNCINPENNRNYSRNISNIKKRYSWSRFVKKINISKFNLIYSI
jgi:hypothetical protein